MILLTRIKLMMLLLAIFMAGGCSRVTNGALSPPVNAKFIAIEIAIPLITLNRFRLRSDTSRMNA